MEAGADAVAVFCSAVVIDIRVGMGAGPPPADGGGRSPYKPNIMLRHTENRLLSGVRHAAVKTFFCVWGSSRNRNKQRFAQKTLFRDVGKRRLTGIGA